jgi:hypothetical protein
MIDYYATIGGDISVAQQLLEEEWTHGIYTQVAYLQVTRTGIDPVFAEKHGKTYTQIATFQGKLNLTPDIELMADYGVTWEEGQIALEATRIHLEHTFINITPTNYDTLLNNIQNDDVLLFPDNVQNPDNTPKRYRIIKIVKRAWYGNTPMIIAFIGKDLPELNQ